MIAIPAPTATQFSAYTLDPEHGWIATHRLPLAAAVRHCKEYRGRTAGALVAVAPDNAAPDPYLGFVEELTNYTE